MSRWMALLVSVVVCTWPLPKVMAQKQSNAPRQTMQTQSAAVQTASAPPDEIVVGQRMYDVVAIMQKNRKKQGGGFQLNRNGEGAEEILHIACVLDEQAIAGIFYKAGTEQVTSLGVAFSQLNGPGGKAHEIWVNVRKITFHPDGSYSLHFEKPTPPKPAAKRPQSVLPTNPGNGQLPPNAARGDARY